MSKYTGRYYLHKKIRIISYITAAFLCMGGFLLQEHSAVNYYRMQIGLNYQHEFSELVTAANELESSLQKSLYLNSAGLMCCSCMDVVVKAEAAQMALSELPFSDTELEHTSKTGDYVCMLLKKSASGSTLAEEDYSNLKQLADHAGLLSDNLTNLFSDVQNGIITIERSQDKISETDDKLVPSALADSFVSMESEFPEMPSLIYDGPFSTHITGMKPVYLENEAEISAEEAVERAAKFTGFEAKRFRYEYTLNGELPVYVFSTPLIGGDMLVEVSLQGGVVTRIKHARAVSQSNISAEDGVYIAEHFLSSRGYDSMQESYYQAEENEVTVNFAYVQNGVICYPDLAMVTVALDTGSVTGFENTGYVMSHRQRNIPQPKISAEDAGKRVTDNLTILSHALAVIPTAGKNEVFCHEFKCENSDGQHFILYINAETGLEEKLLILIESENGTLTL